MSGLSRGSRDRQRPNMTPMRSGIVDAEIVAARLDKPLSMLSSALDAEGDVARFSKGAVPVYKWTPTTPKDHMSSALPSYRHVVPGTFVFSCSRISGDRVVIVQIGTVVLTAPWPAAPRSIKYALWPVST